MMNTLRDALFKHGSTSPEAGLEAYCVAVAIREVSPPLDCLPVIILHLPELARKSASGSIRSLEQDIRALCQAVL